MSVEQNVTLLQLLSERMGVLQLASRLAVSAKTISRWRRAGVSPRIELALKAVMDSLRPDPLDGKTDRDFTFIDLFAGIGGIRKAFEGVGGQCLFTSEWNEWSKKTYLENFGMGHPFAGDIVTCPEEDIPEHDVLLAGFPCQPFSIAGVSKKNSLGRPHGFECTTQGTLFFDVARIIKAKRPAAFLLENVKNLMSHDQGNTFRVIMHVLRQELGYHVDSKVIDARHWVPQHRERIIIVGFREKTPFSWDSLDMPASQPVMSDILHPEDGSESPEPPYTSGAKAAVSPKYTLSDHLWKYLQDYAEKHRAAGNGFGYGLVDRDGVARTLSARYYKDGSEILISRGKGKNPRRLTPRECARLMGFPDDYRIPVSDTQAYRQFGNSVAVPVIREVARIMKPHVLTGKRGAGSPLAYSEHLLTVG
ncbi:MAG: DNA (cytosine-5-)-methyltransferase [Planctomycetes bacterium]|nr:DNA (cytosine-5-)-methyltransferase [Planctomycetota bacterium]